MGGMGEYSLEERGNTKCGSQHDVLSSGGKEDVVFFRLMAKIDVSTCRISFLLA